MRALVLSLAVGTAVVSLHGCAFLEGVGNTIENGAFIMTTCGREITSATDDVKGAALVNLESACQECCADSTQASDHCLEKGAAVLGSVYNLTAFNVSLQCLEEVGNTTSFCEPVNVSQSLVPQKAKDYVHTHRSAIRLSMAEKLDDLLGDVRNSKLEHWFQPEANDTGLAGHIQQLYAAQTRPERVEELRPGTLRAAWRPPGLATLCLGGGVVLLTGAGVLSVLRRRTAARQSGLAEIRDDELEDQLVIE